MRPRLRRPVRCSSAARVSIFTCWRAAASAAARSSFYLPRRPILAGGEVRRQFVAALVGELVAVPADAWSARLVGSNAAVCLRDPVAGLAAGALAATLFVAYAGIVTTFLMGGHTLKSVLGK
ncbi:MAG: hypothetical protein HC900_05730 [Methylacidiphilales bacterium]|nr:hypothetical protein [Candidatus Methylacidiphilales bacterium]